MDKNTRCSVCVRDFFKVSNLRRHIKKFHPEHYVPTPQKQFAFTCEDCGKHFSYLRNYKSHKKIHDPNAVPGKQLKNCPLCDFKAFKQELCDHFGKVHSVKFEVEQIRFDNLESFLSWKIGIEKNTKSGFVTAYSQQTKYYDEIILFVCHRSGNSSHKNTKKIGFCPASIKMMKNFNGTIKVIFTKTHVGHVDEEYKIIKYDRKVRIRTNHTRHKSSLSLSTDLIQNKDVSSWKFKCGKEKFYKLALNETQCKDFCDNVCEDCKVCVHKFSCDCKDWTIKKNMCVHVHLLCRKLNVDEVIEEQKQQSNSDLDISDLIIYDRPPHDVNMKYETIVKEIPETVSANDKNVILEEFSNLLYKCDSISIFREIVSFVDDLKSRLHCSEMSSQF